MTHKGQGAASNWLSAMSFIVGSTLRINLIYKARAALGLAQPIITFYAFIYVWQALSASNTSENIKLTSLVTYSLLATIFRLSLPSEAVSRLIEKDIATGDISSKMVRPVSFAASAVAMAIGNSIASTILKAIPLAFIAYLVASTYIVLRSDSGLWGTFFIVFFFAYVAAIMLDLIAGYLCFWVFQGRNIRRFFEAAFVIFSGQFVPLALLPAWIVNLSVFLPFRLIYNDPASIAAGITSSAEYVQVITRGATWIVVLFVVCCALHTAVTQRVVTQGG
jgi:ABC-2 type transport system permease protein